MKIKDFEKIRVHCVNRSSKTGNQSFHFNRLRVCLNNIAHVVKKIEKSAEYELTTGPACGILSVTGLETRAKAEAAAVTGCDSSEKNIAICLLGRLGLSNQGVSFATFPTQSPLFRAFGLDVF